MNLSNSSPVFIIGVSHRSGTVYLHSLLIKHPQCTRSRIPGEDYLLYASEHLSQYVKGMISNWNQEQSNRLSERDLLPALGDGLLNFITPENFHGTRVICRTPSPYGAINFAKLFPGSKLILIVRNGPDLIESHLRSFNFRFEFVVRKWLRGMNEVEKIQHSSAKDNVIVVKYENLYTATVEQLQRLFAFLNLDASVYDFQSALNAEVIGSSDLKVKTGKLHWEPVSKSPDFKPLERSASWNKWRHYRFNYLAGKVSERFGYELKYNSRGIDFYLYNYTVSTAYYVHLYTVKVLNAFQGIGKGWKGMKEAFRKDF